MKKLVLLCLFLVLFSSLTGCMGPLMHGGDSDDSYDNHGNNSNGHHH